MLILSNFFESLFKYDTYMYALIAALIIGILAPLIGSVVVIRRLSFIADTLSHFSLAGVCLGVLLGNLLGNTIFSRMASPMALGIIFSIIGTFLIEKLRSFYKNYKELSMPIIMSIGVALSSIFIALSPNANANLTSLLFGSISVISKSEFIVIIIMTVIIATLITLFYRRIITLCFDEVFAKISGTNVTILQLLITIVLAIFISVFMNIVGVLLISALMIVPVAAAILNGKSFKHTCILAIIYSEVSIVLGFLLSYELRLPLGSIIVAINSLVLIAALIISNFQKKYKKKFKS